MKMLKQGRLCLLGFGLMLISPMVSAHFEIMEDEVSSYHYGNGQAESFHKAMIEPDPITVEEQKELARQMPIRADNRYYVRFGLNAGTMKIESIKNEATRSNLKGRAIVDQTFERDQNGFEFAYGYAWKNWRWELEWMYNRGVKADLPSIFADTQPPNFRQTTTARNCAFLANFFYEFLDLYKFRPYMMVGAGVSFNNTAGHFVDINNSTVFEKSKRQMTFAWELGAGARYRLLSRLFLDVKYRYVNLGKVAWEPGSGIDNKADTNFKGLSLSFIMLI